jgi:hypothetical protein
MEHRISSTESVVVDWGTQAGNHVPVGDLDGMFIMSGLKMAALSRSTSNHGRARRGLYMSFALVCAWLNDSDSDERWG